MKKLIRKSVYSKSIIKNKYLYFNSLFNKISTNKPNSELLSTLFSKEEETVETKPKSSPIQPQPSKIILNKSYAKNNHYSQQQPVIKSEKRISYEFDRSENTDKDKSSNDKQTSQNSKWITFFKPSGRLYTDNSISILNRPNHNLNNFIKSLKYTFSDKEDLIGIKNVLLYGTLNNSSLSSNTLKSFHKSIVLSSRFSLCTKSLTIQLIEVIYLSSLNHQMLLDKFLKNEIFDVICHSTRFFRKYFKLKENIFTLWFYFTNGYYDIFTMTSVIDTFHDTILNKIKNIKATNKIYELTDIIEEHLVYKIALFNNKIDLFPKLITLLIEYKNFQNSCIKQIEFNESAINTAKVNDLLYIMMKYLHHQVKVKNNEVKYNLIYQDFQNMIDTENLLSENIGKTYNLLTILYHLKDVNIEDFTTLTDTKDNKFSLSM